LYDLHFMKKIISTKPFQDSPSWPQLKDLVFIK
jgi:hypothetical protein